jgi:hypothetical protein
MFSILQVYLVPQKEGEREREREREREAEGRAMQFERNGERQRKKADCVGCLLVGSFFFKERDGRAWRLCMGLADRIAAPRRVLLHRRREKKKGKEKKKKEKKQITGENAVVSANRGEFENAPVRNDNSKGFTRSLGRAERKTGMKAGLSSDIRST